MRAINHALTGAAIGLLVSEPSLAVPMAFLSHFVCDAIPHHGSTLPDKIVLRSVLFRRVLVLDALSCFVLVSMLAVAQPNHWFVACICAFLAASPDFLFVGRFVDALRHKKHQPSPFEQFAIDIQWFQKPIGWVVELAWLIAGVSLLIPFVR
jgi:hypothetical protein